MALLTPAEARLHCPGLDTDDDTVLTELIGAMGGAFGRECGCPLPASGLQVTLESTSYTCYLTGRGGRDLDLDVFPVTAVSAVRDDPTLDFTDAQYLLDSGDYAIVRGRILRLTSTATWGQWGKNVRDAIRVSCTAGWTTIPEELQQAARLAARHAWDARFSQGEQSRSGAGASVTWRDEDFLPAPVRSILAHFWMPGRLL